MLQLALRGVRYNTGRYVATLLAIVTGVAFFAATGFVADRVINALEGDVNRQYGNVDVAIIVDTTNSSSTNFAEQLTIPKATADEILAINGVEAGAGEVFAPVAFKDENGKVSGGATGRMWVSDARLNPVAVVEGKPPTALGEIAIDKGLAKKKSLAVGDRVTLLTVDGPHDVTVVGVTDFGNADAIDQGGTVSIPATAAFSWLRAGQVEYQSLYLRGSSDPAQLEKAIAPLVPKGFVVQTGDNFRQDKRDQIGQFGQVLKRGLQFFALLALLVGAFVIYNTFNVIVAQRQRELAVLSAIGATPKQLKRSLRYEGLVIGILGSALGVAVGVALAYGLIFTLQLLGIALPGSGIVIRPDAVIGGIIAGTVITYFSVTIPARRAARTEPIEALRDAAAETRSLSRRRGIVAAVFVALGLGGLLFGTNPAGIGTGALLLVVGTIVAGPFIATASARGFRQMLKPFGLEGQLAVDNSARNPKRTATTANALLIGVFLVTFVTVAGTSLKDFVVVELQKLSSADLIVSSDGGSLDATLVKNLQTVPGVEQVTTFRRESVTVDGKPSQLSTADTGGLLQVAKIKAEAGSLDDLQSGTIAVDSSLAGAVKIGSTVNVGDRNGQTIPLKVVAILDATVDAAQVGNLTVPATFDSLVGETAPTAAFIDAKSGTESNTQTAIEDLTAQRPDITVAEGNAIGRLVGSVFDFLINAVNGLLLMSVIVALIGIVNTLSLSILERRRELGLLRVIGMTDKRVQRMVRLESGLIATLGTVTGLALGLIIGWGLIAAINRVSAAGIGFGFPGVQLLLVLVLGVVLGFLASFLPARRSTHLEVLDAIASV